MLVQLILLVKETPRFNVSNIYGAGMWDAPDRTHGDLHSNMYNMVDNQPMVWDATYGQVDLMEEKYPMRLTV